MFAKSLLKFVFVLCFFSFTGAFAAQVSFSPEYSDPRFLPADKFHAGCTNALHISVPFQENNVNAIRILLAYSPKDIKISRIVSLLNSSDAVSYSIESDKIIFNYMDTLPLKSTTLDLFQVVFKSNQGLARTNFQLLTGSYYLTKDGKKTSLVGNASFLFEDVPECEPDIIPPSATLVLPKSFTQRIALDAYFVFDLEDLGKGIDWQRILVNINGEEYFVGSDNVKVNDRYLTVYPNSWFDVNQKVDVSIALSDKQIYGGPNKIEKKFVFRTATGLLLQDSINPMLFRKVARGLGSFAGTSLECQLLHNLYLSADLFYKSTFSSLLKKLSCDLTQLPVDTGTGLMVGFLDPSQSSSSSSFQKIGYVSFLALLGWILFLIVFLLKLHYFFSYRRHKKITRQMGH